VHISMHKLIDESAAVHALPIDQKVKTALMEFYSKRLEQLLLDKGATHWGLSLCCASNAAGHARLRRACNVVTCMHAAGSDWRLAFSAGIPAEAARAVLVECSDDAALAVASASELADELAAGDNSPLPVVLQALARPTRLIRDKAVDAAAQVDASLFECQEERDLWASYTAIRGSLQKDMRCTAWLKAVLPIVDHVNAFFTQVFVMAEDESVRRNRLALVRDVANMSSGIVDLSELPGFWSWIWLG
jgi:glycyl-tRNA synthetase beta subunit